MLKIRVMPTLLFKDVGLVKGSGFKSERRVGAALQAIRVYNRRGVDELVLFDISATPAARPPDFAQIDLLADECFMPLTVGGGVRDIDDFSRLLGVGADKISINSAATADPTLIARASQQFGSQCVVVAIDARRHLGAWRVYSHCGSRPTELDPVTWARQCERLGAGEILLTSMDRDGTKAGYDIALTRAISDAVSVPVIASGGVGTLDHLVEGIRDGHASAVLAASIFHFGEHSVREAKMHMAKAGLPMRLDP